MTNDVKAILDERGSRYGDFRTQAEITQLLKNAMQAHRGGLGWLSLKAFQREALEMIASKIGRVLNGDPDYEDSWRDIAGYATLVADMQAQGVVVRSLRNFRRVLVSIIRRLWGPSQ